MTSSTRWRIRILHLVILVSIALLVRIPREQGIILVGASNSVPTRTKQLQHAKSREFQALFSYRIHSAIQHGAGVQELLNSHRSRVLIDTVPPPSPSPEGQATSPPSPPQQTPLSSPPDSSSFATSSPSIPPDPVGSLPPPPSPPQALPPQSLETAAPPLLSSTPVVLPPVSIPLSPLLPNASLPSLPPLSSILPPLAASPPFPTFPASPPISSPSPPIASTPPPIFPFPSSPPPSPPISSAPPPFFPIIPSPPPPLPPPPASLASPPISSAPPPFFPIIPSPPPPLPPPPASLASPPISSAPPPFFPIIPSPPPPLPPPPASLASPPPLPALPASPPPPPASSASPPLPSLSPSPPPELDPASPPPFDPSPPPLQSPPDPPSPSLFPDPPAPATALRPPPAAAAVPTLPDLNASSPRPSPPPFLTSPPPESSPPTAVTSPPTTSTSPPTTSTSGPAPAPAAAPAPAPALSLSSPPPAFVAPSSPSPGRLPHLSSPPPFPSPLESSAPTSSAPPPSVLLHPPSLAPDSSSSTLSPPPSPVRNSSTTLPLSPPPRSAPAKNATKAVAPASLPSLAVSPAPFPTSNRSPPQQASIPPKPAAQAPTPPAGTHQPAAQAPSPAQARPRPPQPQLGINSPASAPQTSITRPRPPVVLPGLVPPPTRTQLAQPPVMVFPSPPHAGCDKICSDPSVTTLPGTRCGCVIPMQVGLALQIPISAFMSLVSELAVEIALGTSLDQMQVQVAGASALGESSAFTETKVNLVPLANAFRNQTAFHIAQLFWSHRVPISEAYFVNYSVLYVIYPGLPVSSQNVNRLPPTGAFSDQPLGVDIFARKGRKLHPGFIAIITLSCAFLLVVCLGMIWLIALRHRRRSSVNPGHGSYTTKQSTTATLLSSSSQQSSASVASSFIPYVSGTVRTFSLAEMTSATDGFDPNRVIGQGGFGRVYSGVLADATKIAVKVLIREDRQGDREFAAEVEMLSRLHHRNLVKLVGICVDEDMRCLVYELIPNGSVDSHLHGDDRKNARLTWKARLKIALGAARGLAYLHEDSYPRVIHRDFKSSNILLEADFTPKVSDFGLAKAASEELTGHISTRVMGTFGYVAPEYAMTGHLLVKSDVYSYGVVLLELLSGRKPVDMSRPQGQENLVTWARPLLTSLEGLDFLIDPELRNSVDIENLARVTAIASMCVQPEVSQRPFMGEVVQALKLVCSDMDVDVGEAATGSTPDNSSSDAGAVYNPKPGKAGEGCSSSPTSSQSRSPSPSRTREWDFLLYRSSSSGLNPSGDKRAKPDETAASSGRHSAPEPIKYFNKSGRFLAPAPGSVSEHGVRRHRESTVWP